MVLFLLSKSLLFSKLRIQYFKGGRIEKNLADAKVTLNFYFYFGIFSCFYDE